MSDEEHQSGQEHHEEDAPEINGAPEEVAAASEDQEQEPVAAAAEEEPPAQQAEGDSGLAEEYEMGDLADRRTFLAESRRIDESAMTIIRGLSVMTNVQDEEVRANLADVFADIQAEEANLFSPMPDYIAQIIDNETAARAQRNKGVHPHDEIAAGETAAPVGDYAEEHRAFVDPSKQLSLPYSLLRDRKENPNRNTVAGVYHDIFYGDGSQCVFSPPEDNKRVQLEREKAAHALPRRAPISYEPAPRRTLKVSDDFVPACATGVSASQRDSANPVYRRSSGFSLRTHKPASTSNRTTRKSASAK